MNARAFFLLTIAAASPTQAAAPKAHSLRALVVESGVVLEGDVGAIFDAQPKVAIRPAHSAEVMQTWVRLDSITAHKGSFVGSSVYLRLPGGATSDRQQVFENVPTFSPGDHVLVFGVSEGASNLVNLVDFASGVLMEDSSATPSLVTDGTGRHLAALPMSALPVYIHDGSTHESEDGNAPIGSSTYTWGQQGAGVTGPATGAAMQWSAARSGVISTISGYANVGRGAQTVDHTGVTP